MVVIIKFLVKLITQNYKRYTKYKIKFNYNYHIILDYNTINHYHLTLNLANDPHHDLLLLYQQSF